MREQYEVKSVSWLDEFGTALLAAILGILLFLGSFVVLVWNEGRLNLATVAQTAVDLSAIVNPAKAQAKLVSVTDRITATTPLGDDRFLLPGKYVVVDRTVQMYAWDEERKTERRKQLDGTETQVTIYTYETRWSSNPEKSENFKYSQNHRNPPKAIPDQLLKVSAAKVGRYTLDMNSFSRLSERRASCDSTGFIAEWGEGGAIHLPQTGHLRLTTQNSRISGTAIRTDHYIFQGVGSPQTPQIGDIRVCYTVLPVNTQVTVFGKLNQNQITPYLHQNTPLYRLLPGTREAAIATLQKEHTMWTWIFRGAGFLMMWFGLMLTGSPFSVFTAAIPGVGAFIESFLMASSLITAFVLSAATILLAMLLHHPIALLLAIGVTVGTLLLFRRRI
ncbi:TMEM43 family protein [Kovacikia minuta CCNUW1]|uniref:TMEM43 family protein n=1 Tax=Kovacikia minuta TaxID=2931930 RepID=UPI001CCFDE7D|nr:TMEM43 family protein [Kovacikia minuta]UBF23809.1 TMEM43 family protein [Kovacikia minuta CCNUW1]